MTTTHIPFATFHLETTAVNKAIIEGAYIQHHFDFDTVSNLSSEAINQKINSIIYAEDPKKNELLGEFLAHFTWHLN